MKFLHTGDWHLGKTLHNTPLVEDQENLLKQVLDIFEEARKAGEPYDALMIPGDLYDRAIPSVAAVKMFDRFLDEMSGRFMRHTSSYLRGTTTDLTGSDSHLLFWRGRTSTSARRRRT